MGEKQFAIICNDHVIIIVISIGNSRICSDIWHKYHE